MEHEKYIIKFQKGHVYDRSYKFHYFSGDFTFVYQHAFAKVGLTKSIGAKMFFKTTHSCQYLWNVWQDNMQNFDNFDKCLNFCSQTFNRTLTPQIYFSYRFFDKSAKSRNLRQNLTHLFVHNNWKPTKLKKQKFLRQYQENLLFSLHACRQQSDY